MYIDIRTIIRFKLTWSLYNNNTNTYNNNNNNNGDRVACLVQLLQCCADGLWFLHVMAIVMMVMVIPRPHNSRGLLNFSFYTFCVFFFILYLFMICFRFGGGWAVGGWIRQGCVVEGRVRWARAAR